MFNLIPISLLIASLGGVVYVLSSHLSSFSASGEENNEEDESSLGMIKAKFAGLINQLPLNKMKARSLYSTQKLLHQMRAILLKTDNRLMKIIGKISEKEKSANDEGKNGDANRVDFWNDLSNYKEEVPQNDIIKGLPEIKIELAVKKEKVVREKIFDIKPAVKTQRTRKSSKTTPR